MLWHAVIGIYTAIRYAALLSGPWSLSPRARRNLKICLDLLSIIDFLSGIIFMHQRILRQ